MPVCRRTVQQQQQQQQLASVCSMHYAPTDSAGSPRGRDRARGLSMPHCARARRNRSERDTRERKSGRERKRGAVCALTCAPRFPLFLGNLKIYSRPGVIPGTLRFGDASLGAKCRIRTHTQTDTHIRRDESLL